MKIVEMFLSIDGEGKRTGKPTIFIRTFGCNLSCSYCDSKYACEEDKSKEYGTKEMTVPEIIDKIIETWPGIKSITFTGGEPLLTHEAWRLLQELSELNFDINVETNGSRYLGTYKKDKDLYKNVWFTMDYKCPSSNMQHYMDEQNLYLLDENDVLKFVVGNESDLSTMQYVVETYKPKAQIYVSPIFGKIEPKDIVEYVLGYPTLSEVRVQLQLHKLIWSPDTTGV